MYAFPSYQSTALQSWRLVELTSRMVVATALTLEKRFETVLCIAKKDEGSSFPWEGYLGSLEPQTHLQIFLVADKHINLFDYGGENLLGYLLRDFALLGNGTKEFLSVVQVE